MPSWYQAPAAPTPNNPRKTGAAALIERDRALLLDQRADDGTWGLIAGTVEEVETVEEAVIREIREETELSTRTVTLFGVFSDPTRIVEYLDGNVYRLLTIVFRVTVDPGDPVASDESRQVQFVPRERLLELDLTPAHRPIVERYLARPARVILE